MEYNKMPNIQLTIVIEITATSMKFASKPTKYL